MKKRNTESAESTEKTVEVVGTLATAEDLASPANGEAATPPESFLGVEGESDSDVAARAAARKCAELRAAVEAIVYAADEPASVAQIADATRADRAEVRRALDELVAYYSTDDRGIEIRKVAGGFKFYTKPSQHEVLRNFIKSLRPPLRLSMPALETLAVISYKQPITQPEIQEIRGVNCAGVLQTLLDKRLITTAGRKQVVGRPILYKTSKDFLMRFGLGDVDELPSIKEFEALAREALGSEDGIVLEEENADAPMAADEIIAETPSPDTSATQNAEQTTGEPGDASKTRAAGQGEVS